MSKKVNKMVVVLLAVSIIISSQKININAATKERKHTYIVTMKKNISTPNVLKDNNADFLTENGEIVSVELTDTEAETLEKEIGVFSVEDNIILYGSEKSKGKTFHQTDWNIKMINAETYNKKEPLEKVKVAIIDSGVNYNSSIPIEERINLLPNEREMSIFVEDFTGHGTSVAGIIAGKSEDGFQIGVNNNVELYSIKVLNENNAASLDKIIEAIYTAIDLKVDIINMSFGTTNYSEALHTAIKSADDAGILLVAAAGNRGNIDNIVEYPANFSEVISVGATDYKGNISKMSSTNGKVDIYAPGELICSTAMFNGSIIVSGTSVAVPHIVGVASALWGRDKSKSKQFIKNLLIVSANKNTPQGIGIVDLEYAMDIYNDYFTHYKEGEAEENGFYNNYLLETPTKVDYVEGSWSKDNHANAIEKCQALTDCRNVKYTDKAIKLIVAGIRMVDADTTNFAFNKNTSNEHCWWHAGTMQTVTFGTFVPNYFATIHLVEKVMNTKECVIDNVTRTTGMSNYVFTEAKKNLKNAPIKSKIEELGYTANMANYRLVYWGILLHVVTDMYAHRPYVKHTDGNYYYIGNVNINMNTDKITDIPERYNSACAVVKNIMTQCIDSKTPYQSEFITLKQFALSSTYYTGNFKLQNFYEFSIEDGWSGLATTNELNIIKNNSIKQSYLPSTLL